MQPPSQRSHFCLHASPSKDSTDLYEADLSEEHLRLGECAGEGGGVVGKEEGDIAPAHLTEVVRLADQTSAADEKLPVESAELAVVVPPEREQVVLAVEELAEAVQHAVLEPEGKYIQIVQQEPVNKKQLLVIFVEF